MKTFTNLTKLVDHCVFTNSAWTANNDDDLIRRRDDWIGGERRTQLKFEGTKRLGFGGRLDRGRIRVSWDMGIGHFQGGVRESRRVTEWLRKRAGDEDGFVGEDDGARE
jgi:hypothetical protein